jgi:hypothetical protein
MHSEKFVVIDVCITLMRVLATIRKIQVEVTISASMFLFESVNRKRTIVLLIIGCLQVGFIDITKTRGVGIYMTNTEPIVIPHEHVTISKSVK